MEPLSLLSVLGVGWVILHIWLLPIVTQRWLAESMQARMTRAGLLAVLERLRDLCAVGIVTVVVVMLLVEMTVPFASTSTVMPKAIIESLSSLYEGVKSFGESYGGAIGAVGLVGLALTLWLAARQARSRVAEAWNSQASVVFMRLRDKPEELERVLAQPEFAALAQSFANVNEAYARAETENERSYERARFSQVLSKIAVDVAEHEVKFEEVIAESGAIDAPKTPWGRIVRFLTAQNFAKDIGLLRKPLSYVTTGLLMLTLTSWAAEPMADSLRLAVNNLRIVTAQSEVHRDLDTALSRTEDTPKTKPPVPATAAAVRATARLLSHVATQDFLHSQALTQMAGATPTPASADPEFVRAAISGEELTVLDDADAATRVRADTAREIAQPGQTADLSAARNQRLEDHTADAFQGPLARLNQEHPGAFARLQASLQTRYASTMSPLDAQGKLLERLVDQAFEHVDVQPVDELGKQAQKLVKEFGKNAVQAWVDTAMERFVTDTLVESARGEVHRAVNASFEASEQTRDLLERLRTSAQSGWTPGPEARKEREMADAVADQIANHYGAEGADKVALTHSLRGYEEVFARAEGPPAADLNQLPPTGAGVPATETRLSEASIAKEAHLNVPEAAESLAAQTAETISRSAIRDVATDFVSASLSFRVRGVLVGQDLSGSAPSISDIRWTLGPATPGQPTRVALELFRTDRWVGIGDFDPAVVNQALRYAADGRVVATTITPGDGQVVGRLTYLHPALVDTPLGCRVVEADRLIDTFTFNVDVVDTQGAAFQRLAQDRRQMAEWLQRVRMAEAVIYQQAEGETCPSKQVREVIGKLQPSGVMFSPAMRQSLTRFIEAQGKQRPGSTELLRKADACAARKSGQLTGCWCSIDRNIIEKGAYWMPEDHTSQFRERAGILNDQLEWLQRTGDRLGHVDLWVHTTFSMHSAGTDGPSVDERTAAEVAFPSDELDALRTSMGRITEPYLSAALRSPSYEDFMGPVEDFIRLQRLMRAALKGKLARSFPLQKLIDLQRQTRSAVPQQVTIRWEPTNEADEAVLTGALDNAGGQARAIYANWRTDTLDRQTKIRPACDPVSR